MFEHGGSPFLSWSARFEYEIEKSIQTAEDAENAETNYCGFKDFLRSLCYLCGKSI
jgi:hypothetical protein